MRKLQVPLAALMALVALVAVDAAALRESSEAWARGLIWLDGVLLVVAVLAAVSARGWWRLALAGMAIAGGLAWLAAFPPMRTAGEPSRLPTREPLLTLYHRFVMPTHGQTSIDRAHFDDGMNRFGQTHPRAHIDRVVYDTTGSASNAVVIHWTEADPTGFLAIGNAILVQSIGALGAAIGGLLAVFRQALRRRRTGA